MIFDVTNMSIKQARRIEMCDDIDHLPRVPYVPAIAPATRQAQDLRAASKLFALRGQTRNADTCLDLANKLERFGSFVSDKQNDYALMLVRWATETGRQAPAAAPVAPTPAPAAVVRLDALFAVMQGMSKLRFGKLTISRKNGASLCWVKFDGCDKVVGKIENGVLTQWTRQGVSMPEVQVMLKVVNLDPMAAAAKHGLESGECSVCGRDLTDPESLARGIGPICIGKFA